MEKIVFYPGTPLPAFRDFRRADGLLDYPALVSAITREVESKAFVLFAYLGAMLRESPGSSEADEISPNELITLLRLVNNGIADDFSAFAMYQKLRPGMTIGDWQELMLIHEPPLRSTNRAHNLFLSVLENVLGLPKGKLCDLSRL